MNSERLKEKLKTYRKEDIIITAHANIQAYVREINIEEVKENIINPIKLVYSEKLNSRQEAVNRESQIKGWSFAKKKALIDGNKELLIKLSKSTGIGEARNDNGK